MVNMITMVMHMNERAEIMSFAMACFEIDFAAKYFS
jgi:hypothetical protein